MGQDAADNGVGPGPEAGRRVLEVVVIYDDLDAAGRAKHSLEELPLGRAPAPLFSTRLWKVELLENRFLREQAAKEAAMADIILLAVSAIRTLPACVGEWMRRWSQCRPARPCAFCFLVGPKSSDAAGEPEARAALENLARKAGARVFRDVCRAPARAVTKTPPDAPPTFSAAALDQMVRNLAPPKRWGLNE